MIGDLIGKPGRVAVEALLPDLRRELEIDFVTANGENVAGGMGLSASIEHEERILRPLNYGTDGVPGRGWGVFHTADGTEIAVLNFQGRTYMTPIENPFTEFDRLIEQASEPLPAVRVVDFHCELTSEKNAFGIYLDGRVSAVVGTHTHVPTADERIMPKGTAYQSDVGMVGPIHSVIGFDPATVIPRFINGLPTRFEVGSGPVVFNACLIDVDSASGHAIAVERIQRTVEV
jgi:metallophosphoesterase (TIGR00282 family)